MSYYRVKAASGIYHVMCRGVNKQQIFEDDADRWRMLRILQEACVDYDEDGNVVEPPFVYYAYCLMPNHYHLLLRELKPEVMSISDLMQRVNKSYAAYYNTKYQRTGHLYQNRFRSEPVNDWNYFVTLLRYIHQNPVKAGMVERAELYPWSSWREYLGMGVCPLCKVAVTLKRVELDVLKEFVDVLLDDDVHCLDVDYKEPRKERRKNFEDDDVRQCFVDMTGVRTITEFQHLDRRMQSEAIFMAHYKGASFRQLQRLTGLTYYQVRKYSDRS